MFACLTLSQAQGRAWRKPAAPQLVRVEVPNGAPFFLLQAQSRKGQLDFNAIEQAAGRLRTKMLFPQGMELPPVPQASSAAKAQLEPGLRAFAPRRLPLLLCLRFAQQVLRASRIPARSRSVTIVDQKGMLCRSLEPFVQLAGSLRVFTPEPAAYRATAEQLLRRYGITLIVSSSPACFVQSDVVVADDLKLFTGRERGIIFTPNPLERSLPGLRVVQCEQPTLPVPYGSLCPPGIDLMLFASALYELCGVKEMERLSFGRYGFAGTSEALPLEKISALLDESSCAVRVN